RGSRRALATRSSARSPRRPPRPPSSSPRRWHGPCSQGNPSCPRASDSESRSPTPGCRDYPPRSRRWRSATRGSISAVRTASSPGSPCWSSPRRATISSSSSSWPRGPAPSPTTQRGAELQRPAVSKSLVVRCATRRCAPGSIERMALLIWAGFLALILLFLAIDLGVFNKTPRVIGTREALAWTLFYVSLSLAFSGVVWALFEHDWGGIATRAHEQLDGRHAVLQYLTGYVVEYSLSLDNVVVIALIFSYFRVPLAYQHRVLYWGVLGALVFRGLVIGAGAALLARFEWVSYVFGGVLIWSALRMLMASGEAEPKAGDGKIYKL